MLQREVGKRTGFLGEDKYMIYEESAEKGLSREKTIIRTSIIGIIANVFLAGFKAVIGLMTNSIAIVLDAVNNGCDEIMGWCNDFVITHEKNFEDRLLYFEESVKAVPKFRQWLQEFYQSAEKFDTNEHITRPDEGQD